MQRFFLIIFALLFGAAQAETVVPTHIIRPRSVISADAVVLRDIQLNGVITKLSDVVGMEARVALYPGRAIRPQDIGVPALIERNEVVQLIYQTAGLEIVTEGRAMGRGAIGEMMRVMNLSSRATVTGTVRADRSVLVHK